MTEQPLNTNTAINNILSGVKTKKLNGVKQDGHGYQILPKIMTMIILILVPITITTEGILTEQVLTRAIFGQEIKSEEYPRGILTAYTTTKYQKFKNII